jgi:hypothetical protein
MTIKVLNANAWKAATPKGVLVNGVWKTPQKVHTLVGGAWKQVWTAAVSAPPYLYDVEVEYLPNYEVKFTVLDGWPAGDPNEVYMFRCTQMPRNGYVGRSFTKTFAANGYGNLDCSLQDLSSIPGKELKTINFTIAPRA